MKIEKLAELLAELDQWRQQAKDADMAAKNLSPGAVAGMKELKQRDGSTTLVFEAHGRTRRATLIEPSKTVCDDEGLLAELTAKQRKLVLKQTVDMNALADAIDRGLIPASLVDKHVTTTDGTASVRITGE